MKQGIGADDQVENPRSWAQEQRRLAMQNVACPKCKAPTGRLCYRGAKHHLQYEGYVHSSRMSAWEALRDRPPPGGWTVAYDAINSHRMVAPITVLEDGTVRPMYWRAVCVPTCRACLAS